MINKTTLDRINTLFAQYSNLAKDNIVAIREITMAEIPESVYNSNAIENSTLSLEETEDILLRDTVRKDHEVREVYEAKNLAKITEYLLNNPQQSMISDKILELHGMLLEGINDDWAGRYRRGKEWVRVGTHLGANPDFVQGLMDELIEKYTKLSNANPVDNIAWFHAEFETIHPFPDGNGRIGRVIINAQLTKCGYPPIIIPNKGKHTSYYPAFNTHQTTRKHDEFTELIAGLLIESLHKRITLLTSPKIITLSAWAKSNGIAGNSALNKAARGTIPSFRMREKWMIAAGYTPVST